MCVGNVSVGFYGETHYEIIDPNKMHRNLGNRKRKRKYTLELREREREREFYGVLKKGKVLYLWGGREFCKEGEIGRRYECL